MRFTLISAAKLTLFTKPGCGLCDQAKVNLSKAWDLAQKKFDYEEVDISKPENKAWYNVYVRA